MEINKLNKFINASKSWDDLVYRLGDRSLNDKFKGDVFERLTQAYLLTSPQYKSALKNVWMSHEVPSSILDKLNLPREDFGIDIIGQTKNNKFWSIQCKYRSNQGKALTYKELSTFAALSFVTAKNVSLAVVAHSSSKPVRNRKLLKNLTEIGLETWLSLTDQDWKRIQSLCANKQIKLKKRNPRSHQKPAIKKAVTHFKDKKNTRGKLIMPCGTGKSLTAFWIAEALDAKKIILAVPSLHLIKQSLNDWVQEYLAVGINPEWMCVCSDKSAGNVEIDDFDIDLQDLGIPVTTNKDEIRNFLSKRSKHHKIIFTTYQSSHLLKQVCKNQKIKFDLAIFDEAHKTVGVADKSFAALLHENNIHIKHRVFMTATERKIVHRRKDEVVSMDDTKIYGDIFYQLSFKKAIDNGIISDYKIVTLTVTNSQVENLIENNSLLNIKGSGSNSTESIYVATGIALKKAMKKYKINHAISFHQSIPLAKNFRGLLDTFNKEKTLRPVSKNYHVSSKQKTGERAQMLKDFASQKPSLITNARCLTEGVDIPAVDCILFADPKQSLVDIVQATGRAMRPAPGKKFGYVILPLVIPDGYEVDDFAKETAFRHITKVISVLSTQDERIAEEFRLITAGKISKGKIINIDSALPIGHKVKLDKFAESINARVWDKVAKVNFRNFEDARKFAHSLNLKSMTQWAELSSAGKLPPDIPSNPNVNYKFSGWKGNGDWLGTGTVAPQLKKFVSFAIARKFARSLKLNNSSEWRELAKSGKLPEGIPSSPGHTYKDKGWINMGDFLGTGLIATRERTFRSFKKARIFARSLKLPNRKAWETYKRDKKLPIDIPAQPSSVYKSKGWIGWPDFLGSQTKSNILANRGYRDYEDARRYVHSLKLKSTAEWNLFIKLNKLPSDIPRNPRVTYKNKGWISMGDWLGTGNIARRLIIYRDFKEARKYARSLKLKSTAEWEALSKGGKLPADIPGYPNQIYKNKGWISMPDWLGY